MRVNLWDCEIASADFVSLAMTSGCHYEPFLFCHSELEVKNLTSAQACPEQSRRDKLRRESFPLFRTASRNLGEGYLPVSLMARGFGLIGQALDIVFRALKALEALMKGLP